jgi:hypothetical protein
LIECPRGWRKGGGWSGGGKPESRSGKKENVLTTIKIKRIKLITSWASFGS